MRLSIPFSVWQYTFFIGEYYTARKYGFVTDRESEDERELHREVMRAELAYGMHSREKELAAIFHLRDGRKERLEWQNRSRAESWTPEMKEKAREAAGRKNDGKNSD